MKGQDAHWQNTTFIHDAGVARVLAQIENVTFLRSFMRPDGNTVAAVAREHGLTPNATYRQVKRFEGLGLLRVLRLEQRVGRAIRVYGCPARRYFIPREVLPVDEFLQFGFAAHLSEFWKQLRLAVEEGPNPVTGLLVLPEQEEGFGLTFADQDGQPWNSRADGSPVAFGSFRALQLDYADALNFDREMRELVQRYGNKEGSTRYMFGLFVTPTVDAPSFTRE